ncbi:MAG: hypothetical protein F4X03_04405 [Dehalococcoidia bacterium]|nr:hypothetical protein [Dehalococcoidia bacterium]MYD28145.1 hypothetical protein [Dehalococcoidia bacterium]
MLLKRATLEGIAEGRITIAFRRWKRPTVRAGGELRTAIGVLVIDAVDAISESDITADDARRAGYPARDALLADLNRRPDGDLYRVAVRLAGDDPRTALREQDTLDGDAIEAIAARVARFDQSSRHGPWTETVLRLIEASPGVRAPDLAASLGRETQPFKRDVRKLKELGLTESLKVGYRLSPRGRAWLATRPPER